MPRILVLSALSLLGVPVFAGCDRPAPTAPEISTPAFSHLANAVHRVAIAGMILSVAEPPDLAPPVITPSGRCHFFMSPGVFEFTGDVEGLSTVHRRVVNIPCDFGNSEGDHLTGSGPFDGEVSFEGRSGRISGQWVTECRYDPLLPPLNLSCDGVMNARVWGQLEGVRFRFLWGPGFPVFYPLSYTGFAVVTR